MAPIIDSDYLGFYFGEFWLFMIYLLKIPLLQRVHKRIVNLFLLYIIAYPFLLTAKEDNVDVRGILQEVQLEK